MLLRCFIIGLILLLGGCKQENPLVHTWKISRISYTPSGLATPESLQEGRKIEARSQSLANSTFALYEGNHCAFFSTRTPFRQGTWGMDGTTLSLQLKVNTPPYYFEVIDLDNQTLVLTLLDDNLTDGEITILCQKSNQYQYDDLDLLAPEQNLWRVKPTKKETKEQIKARTIKHLDYLIHYFAGVEAQKQNYFETGIISTPFVFYSHGLGLSKETTFSRRWQEGFYDETDALVGYEYLKSAIRTIKKFPRAETLTKEYLLAFKQMRTHFDQ